MLKCTGTEGQSIQVHGGNVQDYVHSGDVGAVECGLRALAVTFFHHEFVRQAVVIALHNTAKQGAILQLLGALADSAFLSTTQLVRVCTPP